jgi:hypothetical protein
VYSPSIRIRTGWSQWRILAAVLPAKARLANGQLGLGVIRRGLTGVARR